MFIYIQEGAKICKIIIIIIILLLLLMVYNYLVSYINLIWYLLIPHF